MRVFSGFACNVVNEKSHEIARNRSYSQRFTSTLLCAGKDVTKGRAEMLFLLTVSGELCRTPMLSSYRSGRPVFASRIPVRSGDNR